VFSLTGCLSGPFDEETSGGLKVTAEEIAYSLDGYCGVGVKIENTSDRTAEFVKDDREVFDGAGSLRWNLPFPDVEPGEDVRGYDAGPEFPTTLDPGEALTHAFVVYCKESRRYTITVNSINAGSASFDF